MNMQDYIQPMFFIVFCISIGIFFTLMKNNSKNIEGKIASGCVSLVSLTGLILISCLHLG